jgi:hypothetical protein
LDERPDDTTRATEPAVEPESGPEDIPLGDLLVTVDSGWGEIEMPLGTWIERGPGPRLLVRPQSVRSKSSAAKLPINVIPLRYRNDEVSRRLIADGLIAEPWSRPQRQLMLLSFFDLFQKAVNQTGWLRYAIEGALTAGAALPQEEVSDRIAQLRVTYRELAESLPASYADDEIGVRAREHSWQALGILPLDLERILNTAHGDHHWCISRATQFLVEADALSPGPN